jgi:hypothetical protein
MRALDGKQLKPDDREPGVVITPAVTLLEERENGVCPAPSPRQEVDRDGVLL